MPLGRSAGIVSSKSASQPASSRSSRWKWIAPYSPGRRRQSVSSPVKSWPVTARVGRLIVVPWRSWPRDVGDQVAGDVEAEVPGADEVGGDGVEDVRRVGQVEQARIVERPADQPRPVEATVEVPRSPVAVGRRREDQRVRVVRRSGRRRMSRGGWPARHPRPGRARAGGCTAATPSATVSATKHQRHRGNAIPVAIRVCVAGSPDDRLERALFGHKQRPAVAIERTTAARDDRLAPARRRGLDEDREREVRSRARRRGSAGSPTSRSAGPGDGPAARRRSSTARGPA